MPRSFLKVRNVQALWLPTSLFSTRTFGDSNVQPGLRTTCLGERQNEKALLGLAICMKKPCFRVILPTVVTDGPQNSVAYHNKTSFLAHITGLHRLCGEEVFVFYVVIQGSELLWYKGTVIFNMWLQSVPGVIQLADHGGEGTEKIHLLLTTSKPKGHITSAHILWQESLLLTSLEEGTNGVACISIHVQRDWETYFSCEPRRENRLDETLAVSGIYCRMVQDSLKAGPEVLDLRSLNL